MTKYETAERRGQGNQGGVGGEGVAGQQKKRVGEGGKSRYNQGGPGGGVGNERKNGWPE